MQCEKSITTRRKENIATRGEEGKVGAGRNPPREEVDTPVYLIKAGCESPSPMTVRSNGTLPLSVTIKPPCWLSSTS